MSKMDKGSSSSSSTGSQESGSTSAPTTPNSEQDQQNVKIPDTYDEEISVEYSDQLPKVPGPWLEGLEPLAIDSSTPDAWIPRDERM